MKKIRKMICIATITLMACFACTACGTTYQEAVSEEHHCITPMVHYRYMKNK